MPNPYSIPWNTAASANGSHTITAVATDLSGNQTTSSAVIVTASNSTVSPGPITPPPLPIVVPSTTIVDPIPIGVLFYNTLGEFSTFTIEAVFPSDLTNNGFDEDWINVVRDFGVTGVGDETAKIQAALDAAAIGTPKSKVLIPGGITVNVGPIVDDLSAGSMFGPMGVCLWIDPGVTLRIDGTLKAGYSYTYPYPNDYITILETRNSFVGDLTNRDETITIEGNGTIDLEGIYSGGVFISDESVTKEIKNIAALRSYKGDKLTVKGITIKHGIFHKLIHGFGSHIDILDVKFHKALKYQSNAAPVITDSALITLDVCSKVRVSGCIARECGVYFGVSSWASKEVIVSENNFSDLYSGDGTLAEYATGTGFGFVDYGMEYAELDMDLAADIYDLATGLDARTLIIGNVFCRNANGTKIFGASWNGSLTKGFFVSNNKFCSNALIGLYYKGLEDYLFTSNQIENNGWDWPLSYN